MYLRQLSVSALALVAAIFMLAACDDSSVDPAFDTGPQTTTIEFESSSLASGRGGTVDIDIVINNPQGEEVTAEVLYANGISETSANEFVLGSAVGGDPEDGEEANGYVAGTVTFPASADDGDIQTFELELVEDSGVEEQLDAVFTLQNIQGAGLGSTDLFTLSLGSVTLFEEDFSDESLDPFDVVDVSSGGDSWSLGTFEDDDNDPPYAEANGFGENDPSDTWLISPALDFTGSIGQTLSFTTAKNFDDEGVEQGLLVKVSTDYDGSGDPSDFEWTDVTDRADAYSDGGYEVVPSGSLDIGDEAFQSDTVYVAFQYISSGTGPGSTEAWQVDDILVRGQ